MSIRYVVPMLAIGTLCTPALAADPPSLIVDEAVYYPHPFTGYVQLFFGLDAGQEDGTYDITESWDESWAGSAVGASGALAYAFSPDFTVQGDAWISGWFGETEGNDSETGDYSYDYDNIYAGVAGHSSWRPDPGVLLGIMGSVGSADDWGTFGTLAVEGVVGNETWRAYGQAGVTVALAGDAADYSAMDLYVRGVLAYYLTPNLSISGNAGVSSYSDDTDGGTSETGVTWGARLEYKPEDWPVTVFAAYQGWGWSGSDDYADWDGTEHALVVGLRLPFAGEGDATLRSLDDTVGLFDMNEMYGQQFVR